jgi:hypothetical protein
LLPSLDSVLGPFVGPLRDIEVVDHYFFVRRKTVLNVQQVARESVLLWRPALDWRQALAMIKINPDAGRAEKSSGDEGSLGDMQDRRGASAVGIGGIRSQPDDRYPPSGGGAFRRGWG